MTANNNQSIIVKRIKKVSGGAHGGAWKVAYADFVTAMMAFFLLLWLLNATEAENLAGLADYFAPTVGVKDEMGIGFRGGKAALSEGIGADKNTNKGIVFGGVPTGPITKVTTKIEERTDQPEQENIKVVIDETNTTKKGSDDTQSKSSDAASDSQNATTIVEKQADNQPSEEMKKVEQSMAAAVEDMVKDRRVDQGTIEIKRTPEGLMVEIKDLSGNSMFEDSSDIMKQKLKDALIELSKIIKNIPNNFAVIGHTSSALIKGKTADYTKWELSSDRANAVRTFLNKNGVQEEQFSRIEGRADNIPYDVRKPESTVNNRVDIIILNKVDTPEHKKSAPNSLLLDTKDVQSRKFIEENEKKEAEKELLEKDKKKPVKENDQMKKLLNESFQNSPEAKKAALEIEKAKAEEKTDVIDLGIKKSSSDKEFAPIDGKSSNTQFQGIMKEMQQEKSEQNKKPANGK